MASTPDTEEETQPPQPVEMAMPEGARPILAHELEPFFSPAGHPYYGEAVANMRAHYATQALAVERQAAEALRAQIVELGGTPADRPTAPLPANPANRETRRKAQRAAAAKKATAKRAAAARAAKQ